METVTDAVKEGLADRDQAMAEKAKQKEEKQAAEAKAIEEKKEENQAAEAKDVEEKKEEKTEN